jgi:ABC-type sugar transport system permease subunit
MKPEDWLLAAMATWLVATVVAAIAWLISDRSFLEAHRRRYHQTMSDEERWEGILADPRTARRIPGDTISRMNAVLTSVDDPVIERMRRRTLRLLVLVPALMFGGLPAALILMLAIKALLNYGGVLVLPGVAISATWIVIIAVNFQRHRRSPTLIIGGVAGVLIGVGLAILLPVLINAPGR